MRITVFSQGRRAAVLAAVVHAVGIPLVAEATSYTWNGNNNGNWNFAANWVSNLIPTVVGSTTESLTFRGSGAGNYTATNNFGGSHTLNAITLDSSGNLTRTVAAGTMVLGGTSPQINQNNTGPFALSGTWSMNGGLNIGGTGSGSVSVAATLSGAGGLNKTGNFVLTLTGSNGYSGGTTLSGGTIQAGTNTALGTGTLVINAGTTLRTTGNSESISNPITVNGAFALGLLTNFSGTTTLASDATIFVENFDSVNNSSILSHVSEIGPHSLTVSNGPAFGAGGGSVQLIGDNSFTGTLTVNTNVRLGGSASTDGCIQGDFVVNNGGVLVFAQSNIVKNTSNVTVNAGGTLNFSNAADTIATLSGGGTISNLGVGGLTLDLGSSATFSGAISGIGPLILRDNNGAGTQTLSSANTYAGGTTVAGGMLRIAHPGALANGPLTVTGGKVSLASVLTVSTLAISNSGIIDIADKGLIVNYIGSSPATDIRQMLKKGYGPGDWSGTTDITSSAANADTGHHHTLAYGDAAALGITNLGGQTITGDAIVVKYTYPGDSNLDGIVDLDNDFSLFVAGYNKQLSNPLSLNAANLWVNGDYNYDGVIDLDNDFSIFVDSYAAFTQDPTQLAQLKSIINSMDLTTAQKNVLLSVVPEPGSVALVVSLGAAMLMPRGRRRELRSRY